MTRTLSEFVADLERFGDRELFIHRGEYRTFSWSYRRVALATRRMAALLRQRGVEPGDRLMLWGPNTPEWAVAFLGALLAGSVPVPIDLRFRPEFLRGVSRQTEARLLFYTRLKPDPELGIPAIPLEELEELLAGVEAGQVQSAQVGEDELAEILYTSGTTAQPKGVMLTHRNLLSELEAFQTIVPPEPEYRFLSVLPLSHIFEQMGGLLLPMVRGGTIVYIGTVRPSALLRALHKEHPNAMMVVPRFLELLRDRVLREMAGNSVRSRLFHWLVGAAPHLPWGMRRLLFWPVRHRLGGHLKYLVAGGATLDPDLERFWDALGMVVLQGYGLTETASAVSCNRVEARRVGSVGKLLANQEARLASGEIQVRGPNVTPGYYQRPDLTAEAFEDGWLKTGDIGRFDPDGFLYIRGRKKELIVTSAGINVYPEDVEAALDRVPGVKASAAVERSGAVHAVLLVEEGVDPRQVVREANTHLDPSQKIRGYTVWPEPDFPRTPTMKVRRASVVEHLREAESGRGAASAEAGATPLQQVVAEVAGLPPTKLKGSEELGVDLGMGSAELLDLVSRLEGELGVDLPEEEVTQETTVSDLERLVAKGEAGMGRVRFPWWSLSSPVQAWRRLFQRYLLFPSLRAVCRLEVSGLENLQELSGPSLLAANHTSHLDVPAIMMALPIQYRDRTVAAAWAEYFEGLDVPEGTSKGLPLLQRAARRLEYYLAAALIGILPLPQTRVFRPSLRDAGELVDMGWNVLVFPEGARTVTGGMAPFKEGVGIMASWLRVPVVPVRVEGLFRVLPPGSVLPRPGSAAVRFGRPLPFPRDASYLEIARRVEEAVRGL